MPRVKRGFTKHRRHVQVLRMVRGQRTSRGHLYRTALQAKMRSLYYAYRDRRTRKRDMRALWITRINAAARQHGVPGLAAQPHDVLQRQAVAIARLVQNLAIIGPRIVLSQK